MKKKLHIKKGDTVKILSGESRGETGRVLAVYPKKERALVEGQNMITKHNKPSTNSPQGGIEKKEAPIHISNLMVVDSKGVASRIGRKPGENGKLMRYSKKTGEEI